MSLLLTKLFTEKLFSYRTITHLENKCIVAQDDDF